MIANTNTNAQTSAAQVVQSLADRLLADPQSPLAQSPLTPEERALLAAALKQMAADELLLLKQQRLLALSDELTARVRALATSALASVRTALSAPAPDSGYDFAAADRARADLARTLEQARSAKALIAGVLTFARDIAVIAG